MRNSDLNIQYQYEENAIRTNQSNNIINKENNISVETLKENTAEEAMDSKWVIGSPTYLTVFLK